MRSLLIAITAIGLAAIPAPALPEETDNAKQVLAVLKGINIEHRYITDAAYYLDEKIEGRHFYFMDEPVMGMQFQLRYDVHSMHSENLQLNITEPGADYNVTGSTDGVMFRYKVEF